MRFHLYETSHVGKFDADINFKALQAGALDLVVEDGGSFDRVMLGDIRDGVWRQVSIGGGNAVRYVESYIAPGEELETGLMRLPSRDTEVTVRWHVVLSTGEEVSGETRSR